METAVMAGDNAAPVLELGKQVLNLQSMHSLLEDPSAGGHHR
ncbi:hypothetical protein FLM9_308 [Candidatus Synechococcus spongiarum]|uniref:Uncharacterized protein n=1 Tax=Candidatus Synechococcus spongiarum TaxID=431041 RepID=A0A170T5E3_9SYNE|nr:hypothetical protein FLM9_308 [Candidatus Synechococcus spongiarum]